MILSNWNFHWIGTLGKFSHRVTMSICLSICVRHWVHFFIGPEVTWSVPGFSLVLLPIPPQCFFFYLYLFWWDASQKTKILKWKKYIYIYIYFFEPPSTFFFWTTFKKENWWPKKWFLPPPPQEKTICWIPSKKKYVDPPVPQIFLGPKKQFGQPRKINIYI